MTFHAPYRFRIMTEIQGQVIELMRRHRPFHPSDETFWTEGREDRSWVEFPLLDKECITSRPMTKRPATAIRASLRPEENAMLENRGLKPGFKL